MLLFPFSDSHVLLGDQIITYPGGYVRLPCHKILKGREFPSRLLLRDTKNGKIAPSQVFKPDREEPELDFLIIDLKAYAEDAKNLSSDRLLNILKVLEVLPSGSTTENYGFPQIGVTWGPNGGVRGVKVANGQLEIWFNLIPAPQDTLNDWNWYAGSTTSIILRGREVLESFRTLEQGTPVRPHWVNHDPQKRCMQVDKLTIWDDDKKRWSTPIEISYKSYNLTDHAVGPLGASFTIETLPLPCNEKTGKIYKLYRTITLLKDTNYILEEMFVRQSLTSENSSRGERIGFKAHYFTFMDLSRQPIPWQGEDNKVFMMSSCISPGAVYGFQSSISIIKESLEHPTIDFPRWNEEQRDKTFSWELSSCEFARCSHWFDFLPEDKFFGERSPENLLGMNVEIFKW